MTVSTSIANGGLSSLVIYFAKKKKKKKDYQKTQLRYGKNGPVVKNLFLE